MPSPQRTCRDDLAKDLGALLHEGTATDATLRISNGEEVFRAHRILLAARSPVFKGMLLHPGMAEAAPDGEVQVMDLVVASGEGLRVLAWVATFTVHPTVCRHLHRNLWIKIVCSVAFHVLREKFSRMLRLVLPLFFFSGL